MPEASETNGKPRSCPIHVQKGKSDRLRIAANFVRLFGGFVIGVLQVRVLLSLGEDLYGAYVVLFASTALAALLHPVVKAAMVPKLGEALHDEDKERFRRSFNSALLASTLTSLLTLIPFVGIWLSIGVFDIPVELQGAARTYVLLIGFQVMVAICFDPFVSAYVVTGRMVEFNIVLLLERAMPLIAALTVLFTYDIEDTASCLVGFAAITMAGKMALWLLVAARQCWRDERLRPRPAMISWDECRGIFTSLGWNAAHVVGTQLHQRLNVLITNLWLGFQSSMLFSLAAQLAMYIEQLTMGLVIGLDGLATRYRRSEERQNLRRLASHQMFLQASLIFPATAALLLSANELIALWIGDRLEDPATSIPTIAAIARLLVVGIAIRSLSESWIKILNGIGRVSSYSPLVLAGGILNPGLIAIIAVCVPQELNYLVPAISFIAITTIVHLLLISRITRRALEAPLSELFRPCLVPCIATAVGIGVYCAVPSSFKIPLLPVSPGLIGFCLAFAAVMGCYGLVLFRRRNADTP